MDVRDQLSAGLVAFTIGMGALAPAAQAQYFHDVFHGNGLHRDGTEAGYVVGGIGIGRAAFPIRGAVPEGQPYDPYRQPFTYDWPYGYGYAGH